MTVTNQLPSFNFTTLGPNLGTDETSRSSVHDWLSKLRTIHTPPGLKTSERSLAETLHFDISAENLADAMTASRSAEWFW